MADMYFPIPNASQLINPVNATQFVNSNYAGGFVGLALIGILFFISFMALKSKYETEVSFAATMFLLVPVSVFLFILELLDGTVILGTVLLLAVSVFFLYRRR